MSARPTDIRVYDCGRELREGVDFEVVKLAEHLEWGADGVFRFEPEWGIRLREPGVERKR